MVQYTVHMTPAAHLHAPAISPAQSHLSEVCRYRSGAVPVLSPSPAPSVPPRNRLDVGDCPV